MITLEEYLKDPCGALSIPFWKAKSTVIPENMKIVPESEFSPGHLAEYEDEKYFRLYHALQKIAPAELPGFICKTAGAEQIEVMASVINRSYEELSVSAKQLAGFMRSKTYKSDLWILVKEEKTELYAGSGIAEYDEETGEVSLEWIQVLPEYRGRGIGSLIVNELLQRAKAFAAFATVSGKIDSGSKPERLYRKCGFTGNAVWHIMQKKINNKNAPHCGAFFIGDGIKRPRYTRGQKKKPRKAGLFFCNLC